MSFTVFSVFSFTVFSSVLFVLICFTFDLLWFTFGLHLVYIWITFGLHLVYIRFTFGLHWFTFRSIVCCYRFQYLRRLAVGDTTHDALQLSIYTILESHSTTVVLTLHDLMIRYVLRRYFRMNLVFSIGKVDPYSSADLCIDHDVAHFFMFLANRAFQKDWSHNYRSDVEMLFDPFFWRRVFAHCATIAPNTFVAQVHAYIAGYYRNGELRYHDIFDYVDWLCADEPWYHMYSRNSIERLRCIEERRLHNYFTALYDHECLLFYILVTRIHESQSAFMEHCHTSHSLRDFTTSQVSTGGLD